MIRSARITTIRCMQYNKCGIINIDDYKYNPRNTSLSPGHVLPCLCVAMYSVVLQPTVSPEKPKEDEESEERGEEEVKEEEKGAAEEDEDEEEEEEEEDEEEEEEEEEVGRKRHTICACSITNVQS